MKINLLAVTTDRELLAGINSLNAKENEICVTPASTFDELHEIAQQQPFDAALIDAADSQIPLIRLILDLTEQQPHVKLLILAADEDAENLQPEGVVYDRLLTRPFNNDQLITSLDELIRHSEPASPGAEAVVKDAPPNDDEHEPSLIEIIDAAEYDAETGEAEQVDLIAEDSFASSHIDELDESLVEPADATEVIGRNPEVDTLRLSYCCVLVPRHPRQYLARDLADRAASILPQLHLSRGWRVTGISVRPQYLQWIISLPVDTSPVDAIEEIRQRTSAYFYAQFPELVPAGKNRDFWAPGYMMLSGSQALSPAIIHEFIRRAHPIMKND